MGRTPDRRPGAPLREEEGAYFDEQAAPAATEGQFVYYSGRWSFYDSTGEYDPRSGGGISEAQHKALHDLIHFIDEGPADGWTSGAYKETTWSGVFPQTVIWYTDSGKSKKIVELTITWTGVNPTTEVWEMYDATGALLVTVTDSITYSGIFEQNRTRAWA